jgi:hypothetical protein
MNIKPQFISDKDGKPQFAVLPYSDYLSLINASSDVIQVPLPGLISADRTKITLPNGGPGAHIDLIRLADYFDRRGTCDLAVNQRAQALEKFPSNQSDTLDPFVRRHFLAKGSPYRNTMQVTTEVVDALVDTGMFRRIKKSYPYFYRPVNALEVVVPVLLEYIEEKGRPSNSIELYS